MASVSRVPVRLKVADRGDGHADVFRHLAPATVGLLLRTLPIQARVSRHVPGVVAILTALEAGPEKLRGEFARGDLALHAATGHLWVFLQSQVLAQRVNPLGRIAGGMELLEECAAGDVITISAA